MRCPTSGELPPPPPGTTGWPWTEGSPQLPDTMPDGSPWPRVSIVTPSYNQGEFIEETIRSVLLQGYPNLEYMLIDGGSTDGSVEIIRKYEPWLAYWVSEPDRGQSHAINKGLQRSAGEILAWLNSDDTYVPGAVARAAGYLQDHPDVGLVYGDCHMVNQLEGTRKTWLAKEFDLAALVLGRRGIPQPTVFWRREVSDTVGWLDEDLHYTMDLEYWIRVGRRFKIAPNRGVVATFIMHDRSKTIAHSLEFARDRLVVLDKLFADGSLPQEMVDCRRRAYSNVYYTLGENYLARGDRANARRYLWKGVKAFPFRPFTFIQLLCLPDAVIGSHLGNWLLPRWGRLYSLVRR